MKLLPKIAALMWAEAGAAGIARHSLKRGLHLTLRKNGLPPGPQAAPGGEWILSLTRAGVIPGEQEEAICRRAFGVPATAQRRTNIVDGGWYVVRFHWLEKVEQLALIEAGMTKSTYYGRDL